MSIASELQSLISNAEAIKTAIIAKNPSAQPLGGMSAWPNAISSISASKPEQTKTVTPTAAGLTVTPDSGYALSSVSVNGDQDLVAGNIKNGVNIFGVTGNYSGKPEQTKAVTPTAAGLTVTPDSGYALSSVTVSGDQNLVAGNIKDGVTIFGVTGNYEGSGGGGLQGHELTIIQGGTGDAVCPITIHYADGETESVFLNGGFEARFIFADVAYIYCNAAALTTGNYNYDVDPHNGYYRNILLTEDTELRYNTAPCILKGTRISLWNGKSKRIEDITYDDDLLCWDFDNGKYSHAKPLWIKVSQKNPYYWYNRFESGREILTTGPTKLHGHRFFNVDKGSFLYNTDCIHDKCYTIGGNDVLSEAAYVEGECEYYNIITEYHMNMFANGLLTSCRYNNVYPVFDMKFVVDNGRGHREREEFKNISDRWFYGLRCSEQIDSSENIEAYVKRCEALKA